METYTFHRLVKIDIFFCFKRSIWIFVIEIILEQSSVSRINFVQIAESDCLPGRHKEQTIFCKILNTLLLKNHKRGEANTLHHDIDISLYIFN